MRFAIAVGSIVVATLVSSCALFCACRPAPSGDLATKPAVGSRVPAATLRTADGEPVVLQTVLAAKPTVLVFYRGGWCPYCTSHLKELADIEGELRSLGYQIVAVSPDRPEKLRETGSKIDLGYQLLSDSSMGLARDLGLAFEVDKATIEKYKRYKIDLEEASGESHHQLPVPAVFLVETDGTIAFSHADPDYKVRLSGKKLLAAAREARQ